jgi:hypothetical protein
MHAVDELKSLTEKSLNDKWFRVFMRLNELKVADTWRMSEQDRRTHFEEIERLSGLLDRIEVERAARPQQAEDAEQEAQSDKQVVSDADMLPVLPAAAPTEAKTKKHKLRTNSLDAPIEKAIEQAGNLATATVFLKLKELAINGELPFTGQVEGDALCYTNDNDEPGNLTKNALDHRLRGRRKTADNRE